jgi:hypothetical protein
VQAVMALDDEGKILAYERAAGRNTDFLAEEEYPLLSFCPGLGVLFFLRLNRPSVKEEIRERVERMIGHPYLPLTR